MALGSVIVVIGRALVVAAPKRHAAPERFDVDSSAARRAVVDDEMRKFFEQSVPQTVQTVDVGNLVHADAVFFFKIHPKRLRPGIEIDAQAVDLQRFYVFV